MSLEFALFAVRRRGDKVIGTVRVFEDEALVFLDSVDLSTARGRNLFYEALTQQLANRCPDQHTVEGKLISLLVRGEAELDARPVDSHEDEGIDAKDQAGPYRATPTGLIWLKPTRDGETVVPLTNFVARIEADIAEDDGSGDLRRSYALVVQLGAHRFRFHLPADRFGAMNWPDECLGARAIVFPGQGTKDHARVAIKLLSGEPPVCHVHVHLGWKQIGSDWVYLHADGGIGAAGVVAGIETNLRTPLDRFVLPPPPVVDARTAAIQASLRALDVAPHAITVPLLGTVWRAVIGDADFSVYLAGQSGRGKSELVALAQQHFGASMSRLQLPSSFDSTANAIQALQHRAKDAVLVVDDFCPAGGQHDVARLNKDADRVFRGQGNRSGRQRLNADATAQASRPVRCLTIGTGEDVPRGQSLRARMLIVEVEPGAVQWERLTGCQQDAAVGLYAATTAAFVQWLAGRYDEMRAWYLREQPVWREKAQQSVLHRRTPGILADLLLSWSLFFAFAVESGAVSRAEADQRLEAFWIVLGDAANAQASQQDGDEPAGRFVDLLRTAIASGRAHVAAINGTAPEPPAAWGWRSQAYGNDDDLHSEWRPLGERVGWVNGEDLYLAADAAFAVVQRLGRDGGEGLTISLQTLRKRLNQRGLLRSVDAKRQTLTVRRTLEHGVKDVLHLAASSMQGSATIPDKPDNPDNDPGGGPGGSAGAGDPGAGQVSITERPDIPDQPLDGSCLLDQYNKTQKSADSAIQETIASESAIDRRTARTDVGFVGLSAREARAVRASVAPVELPPSALSGLSGFGAPYDQDERAWTATAVRAQEAQPRPTWANEGDAMTMDDRAAGDNMSEERARVLIISDRLALDALLQTLVHAPVLGLDTETTGLDPHSDRLRLIQLATAEDVHVIDCFAVDCAALAPVLQTAGRLVGHNLSFDLRFLMANGLPIPTGEHLFDTMLASRLLQSGLPEPRGTHSLAGVTERYWSCPAFVDTKTLGMIPRGGVHHAEESRALPGGISHRCHRAGAPQRQEHRRGRRRSWCLGRVAAQVGTAGKGR